MLNYFQHALTIAFFCFFCSACLASKKTRFASYFYKYIVAIRQYINKNMTALAPPLQEGMGDASLAPQGTPPAPPSQGGMRDASLVPQGAAPAPPLQGGMRDVREGAERRGGGGWLCQRWWQW